MEPFRRSVALLASVKFANLTKPNLSPFYEGLHNHAVILEYIPKTSPLHSWRKIHYKNSNTTLSSVHHPTHYSLIKLLLHHLTKAFVLIFLYILILFCIQII
ncbi:hypothetical protein V6Z12_D10G268000 [Gossypium hirsutum]